MPRVSELYYEELGEDFAHFMSSYDVRQRLLMMAPWLPTAPATQALEVGCGTGEISRFLKPRVQSLTVCDISATLAQRVGTALHCRWAAQDACALTWPEHHFDLVVSSECIEHTPDPPAALASMARVLKPGGRLIVTTPNKVWYPVLWASVRLRLRRFAGNEKWLWPAQVTAHLRRAGLRILEIRGCHAFPWQIPGSQRLLPHLDAWGSYLYPLMINVGVAATRDRG